MCVLRLWFLLLLGAFCFCSDAAVLISSGDSWKFFKGRSEASTPDATGWRQLLFLDGSWAVSPAPFYYGETFPSGTVVSDMINSYSTLYFRKLVTIADITQVSSVDLDVKVDDGFIAWINGQEVARKFGP